MYTVSSHLVNSDNLVYIVRQYRPPQTIHKSTHTIERAGPHVAEVELYIEGREGARRGVYEGVERSLHGGAGGRYEGV